MQNCKQCKTFMLTLRNMIHVYLFINTPPHKFKPPYASYFKLKVSHMTKYLKVATSAASPKSTCDFLLVFLWEYAIDVYACCSAGFPFVVALIKARLTSYFRLFRVLSRPKWLTWITHNIYTQKNFSFLNIKYIFYFS